MLSTELATTLAGRATMRSRQAVATRRSGAESDLLLYCFGDFTLDRSRRQLLLSGGEVHLSPKAFELLTALLQHRPRAVSKAELQELLWPSTFVEETNIASLVAEIRRALRDPASSPAFIRTVYGFGYRFDGKVAEHIDAARPEPARLAFALVLNERQLGLMEGANVIGRAGDAAVQIDSPGVSRYHARIVVRDEAATLDDLGSKNGTYLNDDRVVESRPLAEGDRIRLGAIVMTFRIGPEPSPTETVSGAVS